MHLNVFFIIFLYYYFINTLLFIMSILKNLKISVFDITKNNYMKRTIDVKTPKRKQTYRNHR